MVCQGTTTVHLYFCFYLDILFEGAKHYSRSAGNQTHPHGTVSIHNTKLYGLKWESTYFGDRALVNSECLEQLWTMAHCFWMLHDNTHCSWAGAVCYLDPVATQTWHKYNIIPHTKHNRSMYDSTTNNGVLYHECDNPNAASKVKNYRKKKWFIVYSLSSFIQEMDNYDANFICTWLLQII